MAGEPGHDETSDQTGAAQQGESVSATARTAAHASLSLCSPPRLQSCSPLLSAPFHFVQTRANYLTRVQSVDRNVTLADSVVPG